MFDLILLTSTFNCGNYYQTTTRGNIPHICLTSERTMWGTRAVRPRENPTQVYWLPL